MDKFIRSFNQRIGRAHNDNGGPRPSKSPVPADPLPPPPVEGAHRWLGPIRVQVGESPFESLAVTFARQRGDMFYFLPNGRRKAKGKHKENKENYKEQPCKVATESASQSGLPLDWAESEVHLLCEWRNKIQNSGQIMFAMTHNT